MMEGLSRHPGGRAPLKWLEGHDFVIFVGGLLLKVISIGRVLLLKSFLLYAEGVHHHSIEHSVDRSIQLEMIVRCEGEGA